MLSTKVIGSTASERRLLLRMLHPKEHLSLGPWDQGPWREIVRGRATQQELSPSDCNTNFNASVLNEVDSNNDPISRWCKSGTRSTDAFCILCNCTISCAQHGAAAVKRHAGMKKHIGAAARHRDKDGNLLPPKLVQGTLDFFNRVC
ncbi:hypothetical protein HPB51_020199 [Rhipicephalus microplus]|uniref:Uncharacterized protein n=1 Tax=Rhipicephalus microplus TaxID=6941 RepID=A0A9J6D6Y8_RHIMP|nr:hypothetical protein HPB51_020199 [Rhipicephalus microplus]